jgi:hypothetical protein
MLARDLRYSLSVLALAANASASAVACTFPSVDYDDGGPACSVTGKCADDAKKCGETAHTEHVECVFKCNNKPGSTCVNECDSALTGASAACIAGCQLCGQQQPACADASPTASCEAIVGSG